jgi:hypothetical protein
MSPRLAWLGAVLVVSAAACADLWQFRDLETATGEDATTPVEGAAAGDSTAPDVRTEAGSDAHTDARTADATLDSLDAGNADALADGFLGDRECPTTLCTGQCVDTQTDPTHCGSCGSVCPRGAMCIAGACKCPAAQSTPCNGSCVDLATDHNNCGGCGNACPAGDRCANKSCVACQSTDKMCSGVCVDPATDISNCGSCDVHCPSGATCDNGVCACPNGDPFTCPGAADAGPQCVNVSNDPNNCGSCSNVCSLAHATSVCTFLTCTISACSPGYVDCDGFASDGCEVNTTSDPYNCGGCGLLCAPAHATPSCIGSSCLIGMCSPGYADCDHLAPNGCEVNTAGDPANCGGCATVCSLPHATSGCTSGACTIASCNTGFADCDGVASNGCETDLSLPTHCGTCTNACAAGMLCSGGSCVSMCMPMQTVCNGSYCANTTNDVNNCGSCGHVCSLPNATSTCTSSACAIASCATGFADCNGTASDGCEVNTTNDVNHCMSCTNKCTLANATAVCSASACAISMCNMGFKDCDGVASNGCEINTTNDATNCGACGTKCTGGKTCQSSACACPSGQHDCSGTCQSNTDPNYCGTTCGMPCSATNLCFGSFTCPSGTCVGGMPVNCTAMDQCHDAGTCNPDAGTCSNPAVTNGSTCTGAAPGTTCQGGTCSCPAGTTFCTPTDGGGDACANLQTDPNNCGTCDKPCSLSDGAPAACDAGVCGM